MNFQFSMAHVISEMHLRLHRSIAFFEEEERKTLQRQQDRAKTQSNWQHQLDQALRKRLTRLVQEGNRSSISVLTTLKKQILAQFQQRLHSKSDYEHALRDFDQLVQQL
jgi:regulator of PEP synthase PpsR (kinase-PPPase family)